MMERRLTNSERICLGVLLLWLLAALAFFCGGCVYRGAKVTEGTDLAIGLTVPGSEGALTLDALNYLTGFRLGVAENAALKVKYTVAETNSYLGVVTTCTAKTIDATVQPCESAAPGSAAPASAGTPPAD